MDIQEKVRGYVIFGVLVILFFLGCGSRSAKLWNKAKKENTVEAYMQVVEQYPKSRYAKEAKFAAKLLKSSRMFGPQESPIVYTKAILGEMKGSQYAFILNEDRIKVGGLIIPKGTMVSYTGSINTVFPDELKPSMEITVYYLDSKFGPIPVGIRSGDAIKSPVAKEVEKEK